MRAVVIGGNGFIGSHLVDTLLKDEWKVTVYDHSPERYRSPLPQVDYFLEDLGNSNKLKSALSRTDIVFHLASTTIPETSNDDPVFDISSNLIHTVRLLQICVKSRVSKVIFLSSGGTVYGIPTTLPVSENHPTNPICSYGIVKLAIEKYLNLFENLYGLSYGILRPSNPYGERQNPAGNQGAVAVFLGRIAQGQPIKIWGEGEITRDFFHVSDLARSCLAVANKASSRVYNIGSGQGTTLNQLLEVIESVIQNPFDIVYSKPRPFDVPKLILDTERARTELRWEPKISLETGITDTWDWICSLPWSQRVD
jgi:UDP-glucose 4-epimerase